MFEQIFRNFNQINNQDSLIIMNYCLFKYDYVRGIGRECSYNLKLNSYSTCEIQLFVKINKYNHSSDLVLPENKNFFFYKIRNRSNSIIFK